MKFQAELRVGLALAAAAGAFFLSGSGARAAGDPKREASFPLGTSKSGPARYVDANGQLIGYHLDSGVAVRFVGDEKEPISIPLTRAGIAPASRTFSTNRRIAPGRRMWRSTTRPSSVRPSTTTCRVPQRCATRRERAPSASSFRAVSLRRANPASRSTSR
jgi:hypothetical protein